MRGRFIIIFLASGFCAVFISIFALRHAANWLDVGNSVVPSDYTFPLAGGYNERPFTALGMWQEGLTKGILLSVTQSSSSADHLSSHKINQRILMHYGVPQDVVQILPGRVLSTFDEARRLRTFLEKHPDKTVTVVTNGHHTRRTRFILEKTLRGEMSRVQILSAFTWRYEPKYWWRSYYGFRSITQELFKYIFYLVRY